MPQLILCDKDGIHGAAEISQTNVRSTPWNNAPGKISFKGIGNCKETGCELIKTTRKCSSKEFGELFGKLYPHWD